jgi:peptidoglycan/LPS O-acetylase OafA/YrhL
MPAVSRMQAISYDDFKAMRRFPALDGVRAIAAVMVFAFHFGGPAWRWTSGEMGVHLFFVLSGFLITTLLLREEERYGRISLRGFYLRRLFRIMPAYLVVLAATYGLMHLGGIGDQVPHTLFYFLLPLNEFAPNTIFLHSWTIGIEQKFYLCWPVIAFALVPGAFRKRITVTLMAMAGLLAFLPSVTVFPFWPVHYVVILTGCLLAIIMHHPRGYAVVRPLTHPVVATVVATGFVGAHVSLLQFWPRASAGRSEWLLIPYAVAVAIVLPTLLSHSLATKALSLRPMVFVGERSYSLYLIQFIAAEAVMRLVPAWRGHSGSKLLLGTLIVGLLAADLLYRWVEQPMINLGRRFAATRRQPGSQPAEAGGTAEAPATTIPRQSGHPATSPAPL